MPNVDDLKRSRFLTQRDVDPAVLATIAKFEEVNVAVEGAEPTMEWILHFRELEKPLILKPTNGELLKALTGSKEFADWIGYKVVLYVEPNVFFAGKRTGGIRCRAPKNQPKKQPDTHEEGFETQVDEFSSPPPEEEEF